MKFKGLLGNWDSNSMSIFVRKRTNNSVIDFTFIYLSETKSVKSMNTLYNMLFLLRKFLLPKSFLAMFLMATLM